MTVYTLIKKYMKKYLCLAIIASALILTSCGNGKTYFTPSIRNKIEGNAIPLTKIQFYVDRNIELTRVLESGQTQVTAGSVKFVNGQYMNVIELKKGTPGVCTMTDPNRLSISFEVGTSYLNFGRTRNGSDYDPYRILADSWVSDYGLITYEGKVYHLEPGGTNATLLIKTKWLKTNKVDVRQMKGRTVDGATSK
jgi:hypothetical protein